jgi:hypothetical protein
MASEDEIMAAVDKVLDQAGMKGAQRAFLREIMRGLSGNVAVVIERVRSEHGLGAQVDDVWASVSDRMKGTGGSAAPETAADAKIDAWQAGYQKGFRAGHVPAEETGGIGLGDRVEKTGGDYRYPGVVVAVFRKVGNSDAIRVVVESTVEETRGMLHVFAPEQLRKLP